MSAIKNKIRSRRGASITFALLLFLVCAVISSVVIVAASTAGGRLSTIKEMDQRYYAATALAKTLSNRLNGQSATVSYETDSDGKVTSATANKTGILGDVSVDLIKDPNTESIEILPEGSSKTVENVDYEYKVNGRLDRGLLICDIAVTGGKINNGTYNLRVIFASTIMDSKVKNDAGEVTGGKAKVTWKKSSIQKTSAGG